MISHSLDWPSLTVQWLPSPPSSDGGGIAVQKLILGTHTSGDVPNFVMLADAHLPRNPSSQNPIVPKLEIVKKILVDGEVNIARFMPQNQAIIAAKTNGPEVYLFNSTEQLEDSFNPMLKLTGHDKQGSCLSWSRVYKTGCLLSGSNDCRICLWDLRDTPQDNVLEATYAYEGHEGAVEDVSWHLKNENLFGSVGDDCKLLLWDLRMRKFQNSVVAHKKEVNHLSFNPFDEHVLATASSDTTVGLFDMRNLTSPLHTLSSHKEKVFQVKWDPNHKDILASSSADTRLIVWDINRIGNEQLEDGPPEVIFVHGGHTAKISDFSWNKNGPWLMSSVADDKTLQIWKMSKTT